MKAIDFRRLSIVLILLTTVLLINNGQIKSAISTEQKKPVIKYKVTFIELGSVRCVPCRQMQPIMKSIENKYGLQVKVIFYDVWTELGKPMADKYNVQAIPTQVFLDAHGKEFFRHEGFFPEDELVKILKTKDVN
ncbi:MAG: thioredoxin family protein [Paludibacter sp.]|jgi:thioredoxin 1|nr:thioredoxin family protein [Paludibacter sp.]